VPVVIAEDLLQVHVFLAANEIADLELRAADVDPAVRLERGPEFKLELEIGVEIRLRRQDLDALALGRDDGAARDEEPAIGCLALAFERLTLVGPAAEIGAVEESTKALLLRRVGAAGCDDEHKEGESEPAAHA